MTTKNHPCSLTCSIFPTQHNVVQMIVSREPDPMVCHAAVGPPPQLVPPDQVAMAAMDGPLCRKWSPCSKPEKQWLQLQIDLYILTGEFEVTIKIFRNNAMHVCCNSESSLAAKTIFLLTGSFANCDLGHN